MRVKIAVRSRTLSIILREEAFISSPLISSEIFYPTEGGSGSCIGTARRKEMEVGDGIDARACSCSDKRGEAEEEKDEEGTRLIECLRGRLLAERQASRDAKEEAELTGKTLVELERKLREETKLRDKAQKKLELLKMKLGSVETSGSTERSRQSVESCRGSCRSSSTVSMDAEQDMTLNVKQDHLPDPGKNPDQLNSDIRSDDTSSSSSSRAAAVFPMAPELKELKKVGRIAAADFQTDRRHLVLVSSNS